MDKLKKLSGELFKHLDVAPKAIKITKDKEGTVSLDLELPDQEAGILIGYHGETINSLQLLLGVILYKKLGKWIRVIMDVGEYRKMREESIKEMVNRIILEVERTGQPVEMPYLSPLERRIVHMMLTEHKTLTSQSHGEGRDRRVTVKPR